MSRALDIGECWRALVAARLSLRASETHREHNKTPPSGDSVHAHNSTRSFEALLLLNSTTGFAGSYSPTPGLYNVVARINMPQACERRPPVIRVLDADQRTHHIDDTTYHFEVRNDDSLLCDVAHFAVAALVDESHWRASVVNGSFAAAPGELVRGAVSLTPVYHNRENFEPNARSNATIVLSAVGERKYLFSFPPIPSS